MKLALIILDSPKLTSKPVAKSKSTPRRQTKTTKKSTHNIVVVKPAISGPNVDKDPDILTLQVRNTVIATKKHLPYTSLSL